MRIKHFSPCGNCLTYGTYQMSDAIDVMITDREGQHVFGCRQDRWIQMEVLNVFNI